ncbi:virulence factor TspB C-terminal domain-related protein [Ideonella sp.]|uniref:virulence factor TspB C-terminal domain-related protein n=1 Tax=Ideonella sp. TaxID=1929293 RepID=UPI0035AEB03D
MAWAALWLGLVGFGLVVFTPSAWSYGQTGGPINTVECTRSADPLAPGATGCGANIGSLRDADMAWVNSQKSDSNFQYVFKVWRTCNVAALYGNCSWDADKIRRSTGADEGGMTFSMGYKRVTDQNQECPSDDSRFIKKDGKCYCAPGYMPADGIGCTNHSCPSAGTMIPGTADKTFISTDSTDSGFMGCYNGCLVSGAFGMLSMSDPPQHMIAGPLMHTGQQCNGAAEGGTMPRLPSGSEAPSCPPPKCPGSVNGTQVCVECSTHNTGELTKPNPDQNSGGKLEETECSGGVCTTTSCDVDGAGNVTNCTETTTGSGGNNPGAGNGSGNGDGTGDGTGDSIEDFCSEHPDTAMCKGEDGSFSGSCVGAFSCEGDAVQCAIAREQHIRNCEMFEKDTDLSLAGKAALGKGDQPDGLHPYKSASDNPLDFATMIDRTDGLGGACPAGHSVTVAGQSITVLTGEMCDSLAMLGQLVVAVGALLSVFIVFRT